jgi:hypothetical protein
VGEPLKVNNTIDDIIPEAQSITLVRIANCYSSKLHLEPKDVFPPKGTFFSYKMGDNIVIISLPDEINPLNVVDGEFPST